MYKNLIIGILLLAILIIAKSKYIPTGVPIVTTKIDTFLVKKDTTIYKSGKNIYHDSTIYVPIPTDKPIDTLAILKDFYAKNIFKDTILFSEGSISLIDTISENKILGRTFHSQITQKTIQITKEIRYPAPPPKPSLYWGVTGIKDQFSKYSIGAGLIYKSPNKGILQLIITNEKQVQLGYYSKIF